MDSLDSISFMIMSLVAQERQRERENDNLLIQYWLVRQSQSNRIQPQQVGRIVRRIPEEIEDLPIIPDWMFQENIESTTSPMTISEQTTSNLVETFNIYIQDFIIRQPLPSWNQGLSSLQPIQPIKITETKEKLIETGKNDECPITYDPIHYGDSYLCCGECKYNFSEQAILKHLNGNSLNKECPMCRSHWKDYCRYINKDSLREKQEELKQWVSLPKNEINFDKISNNKHIQMYIGDINKTRYNKKWFYGK